MKNMTIGELGQKLHDLERDLTDVKLVGNERDLTALDLWQEIREKLIELTHLKYSSHQDNPFIFSGSDLSYLSASGISLCYANFYRTNLERADLRRACLLEANLTEVDLERADLEGAYLERADLRRACLLEANLKGTNLLEVNFEEASLFRANLRETNLERADLRRANLAGADLRKVMGIDETYNPESANWDNIIISPEIKDVVDKILPERKSYVVRE